MTQSFAQTFLHEPRSRIAEVDSQTVTLEHLEILHLVPRYLTPQSLNISGT